MAERSSAPATTDKAELATLMGTLSPLYEGSKSYGEIDARGGLLSRLTDKQQLMILGDKGLRELQDSKGLTPAHDLARQGSLRAQNMILHDAETFERPEFNSELGPPLDVLAINGDSGVKLRMLDSFGLTAVREIPRAFGKPGAGTRKTTILHELASNSYDSKLILNVLRLPKETLMAKANPSDPESQSVLALIVSGGGSKEARELALKLGQLE